MGAVDPYFSQIAVLRKSKAIIADRNENIVVAKTAPSAALKFIAGHERILPEIASHTMG